MENNKIVLNKCYGKFNLSHEAIIYYAKLKNIKLLTWITAKGFSYTTSTEKYSTIFDSYHLFKLDRVDKDLITVIEKLKDKANGFGSKLEIEDLPLDKNWYIENYGGIEEIKYL